MMSGKRVMALLLSALLVMGSLPGPVFASETDVSTAVEEEADTDNSSVDMTFQEEAEESKVEEEADDAEEALSADDMQQVDKAEAPTSIETDNEQKQDEVEDPLEDPFSRELNEVENAEPDSCKGLGKAAAFCGYKTFLLMPTRREGVTVI